MTQRAELLSLEIGGREMKRMYRVIQEDNRFYPEWRYWFWKWRRFYYTKNSDLNDTLFIRNYKTEDEAWEFIWWKKSSKFTQFDTEN